MTTATSSCRPGHHGFRVFDRRDGKHKALYLTRSVATSLGLAGSGAPAWPRAIVIVGEGSVR